MSCIHLVGNQPRFISAWTKQLHNKLPNIKLHYSSRAGVDVGRSWIFCHTWKSSTIWLRNLKNFSISTLKLTSYFMYWLVCTSVSIKCVYELYTADQGDTASGQKENHSEETSGSKPRNPGTGYERAKFVDLQLAQITKAMNKITNLANQNPVEITRWENAELTRMKNDLAREFNSVERELNKLKETPPEDRSEIQRDEFLGKFRELQDQINEIKQYLQVNNLEFVGLLAPNEGEIEGSVIINACNPLVSTHWSEARTHPLNSRRLDRKPVHVARFVQRKTTFVILSAKKAAENRTFKCLDQDVYIDEHLSKPNQALFAAAASFYGKHEEGRKFGGANNKQRER